MSLTFLAKSSAYSWKISFDGHVLWKRKLIGPCALTTFGAVTAAAVATAAPPKNLRRVVGADVRGLAVDMGKASLCLAPGFSPYRINRRRGLLFQRRGAPVWTGRGASTSLLI